ncbi:CPBP family intramembrane metalloprotease [Duganella sp. FT92W]|uniref:CPBP family intramembrane metalloprotease n=1 Tax=Pseudoduganella rivuli TaxID=2666085 RepID=A0A7X2LT99_9BURK|nr:CPBP family intramembrane glutamic endopeptidase [Pseudoduganella rivuli]MRV73081.1 CPBP family intramembrane metalloprotease [Pseudoduganella rivuli]
MTSPMPNSAARSVWLLTRVRLLRMFNMVNAFSLRKKKGAQRTGTQRKRTVYWILSPIVGALMMVGVINILNGSIVNLHCAIDHSQACMKAVTLKNNPAVQYLIMDHLKATAFSTKLAAAATLQMLMLWLVAVLMPLSSRELAQAEWDLEWLVTLPVQRKALLWGRLLERTVANPSGVMSVWPACIVLAWYGGHGWLSVFSGLVAACLLLMLAALARTLADTGMRLSLAPSQLRNLQALASVVCLPIMYMAMSYSMMGYGSFTYDWARHFPAWTLWTPPGLAVQALTAHTLQQAAMAATLLAAQTFILMMAGVAVLQHQLRAGVVGGGSRESTTRKASTAAPADDDGAHQGLLARLQHWGTTLQRRELRLLSRDRNFLVQSLLVPVVIVGSQLVFNNQLQSFAQIGENQHLMAAVAFGIGSYVLMLSAFQTLNTEGNALWMLYTFPRSLESMLKEKARLWGVLALSYPLLVFAAGLYFKPVFSWQLAWLAMIALAGVVIFSGIAVSLGVFACDPLAQETHARIRPTYSYLYMLLCSLYVYGIYAQEWLQTIAIMVLTSGLSLALWQKARDALPYLLDPAASPPPRVALSDGLIAAITFFVTQLLALLLLTRGKPANARDVALAFAMAGAFVYGAMRLVYWRYKTAGVPSVLAIVLHGSAAAAVRDALKTGLVAGAVASAFGYAYLHMLQGTVWQREPVTGSLWFIAMAVLAAPVFEEFIFRGLIHAGLRRLLPSLAAALGSAAIFAIVHPSGSMVPVFVLGLCTAWAHGRSTSLLAPMVVHAIYNLTIVGLQIRW